MQISDTSRSVHRQLRHAALDLAQACDLVMAAADDLPDIDDRNRIQTHLQCGLLTAQRVLREARR